METACSSALNALATAAASLAIGDCDMAIVCGVNTVNYKDLHLGLQACGVSSNSNRTGSAVAFTVTGVGKARCL